MQVSEGSIYRHVRRGTTYEVLGRAKMQIGIESIPSVGYDHAIITSQHLERVSFVIYRSLDDETLWVRPESEFCDGRFVVVRYGHYLVRTSTTNGSKYYYKSGEGRGWKTKKSEATFYTEMGFAERDLVFASSERGVVSIEQSMEE